MLDLRLAVEARHDLDLIWRYTAERYDAAAADAYLRTFNTTFALLCDHPEAGAVVQGIHPEIRSFGHRQHRCYYRIHEHRIEIIRIAHKAQNARLFLD